MDERERFAIFMAAAITAAGPNRGGLTPAELAAQSCDTAEAAAGAMDDRIPPPSPPPDYTGEGPLY